MRGEGPRVDVRYGRRLVIALLFLVLFDRLAPPLLRRVEARRYEAATEFRFENSDLFALGPLVSYLRENPRSRLRRVSFFGNSVLFGYGLSASDAVPAQFQKRAPGARVFNMAFNGSELGSSYLIAKAMIDSVDTVYVQVLGEKANPLLPSLIPVDGADAGAFGLTAPDRVESRLRSLAGFWRLYDLNYRFQAALLGTSTRQYVYLNKKDIVSRLFGLARWQPPPSFPATNEEVSLRSPRAAVLPAERRRPRPRKEQELLWKFGDLARSRRRHAVFMRIDAPDDATIESKIADFNATFAPWAEIIVVTIPPGLKYDNQHLTPKGAAVLANALRSRERERREPETR